MLKITFYNFAMKTLVIRNYSKNGNTKKVLPSSISTCAIRLA